MIEWLDPEPVTQRDAGDACQFSNCWAAVGVWLADAATGAAKRPTIKAFKNAVGDTDGGVNPNTGCPRGLESDLVRGLKALGIERFSNPTLDRDDVMDLLSEPRRRVFAMAVDYHVWPDDKDCSPAVMPPGVNHMIGIVAGTFPNGAVRVMNPMCVDGDGNPRYQKVMLGKVLEAADAFADSHGRSGIELVGVRRPLPDGIKPEQQRLQELQDRLEAQRLALRRAKRLIERALDE